MSTQAIEKKPSGRIEQERAKRRRRDDMGMGRVRNLAINGQLDPNYSYRWVNDEPGRMHQLTKMDDWDVVTDLENDDKDKGVGSPLERVVDKKTGMRAVLLRKPKEYYDADKAKEQASIASTEASIKQGASQGPEGLNGPHAYVPRDGISIQTPKTSSYTP